MGLLTATLNFSLTALAINLFPPERRHENRDIDFTVLFERIRDKDINRTKVKFAEIMQRYKNDPGAHDAVFQAFRTSASIFSVEDCIELAQLCIAKAEGSSLHEKMLKLHENFLRAELRNQPRCLQLVS